MNENGIVSTGKNEYVAKELKDLEVLSTYARPGSRVYCVETEKVYVCMKPNEWVSM